MPEHLPISQSNFSFDKEAQQKLEEGFVQRLSKLRESLSESQAGLKGLEPSEISELTSIASLSPDIPEVSPLPWERKILAVLDAYEGREDQMHQAALKVIEAQDKKS